MKIIIYDKENGVYTISLLEKGGPIISDSSLEIAERKFRDALILSSFVKKFLTWNSLNRVKT
jgi:hypothetical protein